MDPSRLRPAVLVLPLLVLLATVLAAPPPPGGYDGPVIVLAVPGLAPDVEYLLCGGERLHALYESGADPHVKQLSPSDARALMEADVVIIMSRGHSRLEYKAAEIAESSGALLVEVARLEGVSLGVIGGAENLHMPFYEPGNYESVIRAVVDALSKANPECAHHYELRLESLLGGLETGDYTGALDGVGIVASTPLAYYPLSWLGASIEAYLLVDPEGQVTPSSIQESLDILSRGGVAAIIVDDRGRPLTKADSRLEEIAESIGACIIRIPAPHVSEDTIPDLLERVAMESLKVLRGGC